MKEIYEYLMEYGYKSFDVRITLSVSMSGAFLYIVRMENNFDAVCEKKFSISAQDAGRIAEILPWCTDWTDFLDAIKHKIEANE